MRSQPLIAVRDVQASSRWYEPKVNPNARHREGWLRDSDGYTVVIASPHGDVG